MSNSESFLETKRKPLVQKYHLNEDNCIQSSEVKNKPKFAG